MKKTNILFIFTDQRRLSTVSAYGGAQCKTPNIKRLAREGVLFRTAHTKATCNPARATVMTGFHPHSHGVRLDTHSV
ncbi:sulfatase-like hydrolase/transferase [Candidatus Hydrogenedentota bacterium]